MTYDPMVVFESDLEFSIAEYRNRMRLPEASMETIVPDYLADDPGFEAARARMAAAGVTVVTASEYRKRWEESSD